MANTAKLKQSAVAGKVPTTSQLALGELAVNTTDGKLFLKKSVGGVESVVDLTAAAAGVSSFNTRSGAVSLTLADVIAALGFTPANKAGDSFTGDVLFNAALKTYDIQLRATAADDRSDLIWTDKNDAEVHRIWEINNTQFGMNYRFKGGVEHRMIVLPVGTAMLFAQTAAPTGWTKSTTHNDKALRVVSGTAGSGGNNSFSSIFNSSRTTDTRAVTGNVDGTTLSEAQMPSHNHAASQGRLFETFFYSPYGDYSYGGISGSGIVGGAYQSVRGGNNSHSHSFTSNGHLHNVEMSVQYVDVIIATKD